ncbi:citrate synthase family protein [Roseibium algae]|uniref:Citrate synthase family protein n=1 Tax=Roseibium algae TaxID=3123038 RepID=A0ABU8TLL1_9HYPH
MSVPIYLSAEEAAAELCVRPATLYAYVSRGLIRSVPGPGKKRRYDAADVRRLQGRRDPAEGSEPRPLSGDTVLETRLTMITEDGPFYRGHSATALARSSTLETVATLLWNCDDDPFAPDLPVSPRSAIQGLGPIERLMAAYSVWPLQDKAAFALSPNLLRRKGASMLRYGIAALLESQPSREPVHHQIGKAWGVEGPALYILRAALVLSADHELNTSAFAARCAASTRAPLHAALLSGIGAFAGPRHGANSDRVTAWLDEIGQDSDVEKVLGSRLARGEGLPGFGHRIYSGADPRADCLLQVLADFSTEDPFSGLLTQIVETGEALYGAKPNIDFALSAVQRTLGLPKDAAKVLFCSGRIVGWIAHALEQYQNPDQIRPRASYVGIPPA